MVADGVDLDALSDLRTPWCLRAVTTLRLAERMADGMSAVSELAAASGCDAGALDRVLSHLASRGVFRHDGPGRFGLNAAGRELLDPARRLDLDLDGIGSRMSSVWSTLPEYLRTGQSAYHLAFGTSFWDDLSAHPEVAASFDALMGAAGHGPVDPNLPLTGGWESVRSVVDVGGGTGAVLAALLQAHPGLRGTLVDLPGPVERSQATFADAGVSDRVQTIGGSFFDPLPAGSDVYLLRKVVSNWGDDEAAMILRRCAEAARPDGRVLVIGGVSADGEPHTLEVDMLLVPGKRRTLAEFQDLAATAGLELVAGGQPPADAGVVECRPLSPG